MYADVHVVISDELLDRMLLVLQQEQGRQHVSTSKAPKDGRHLDTAPRFERGIMTA